jgi:hypothetical protein
MLFIVVAVWPCAFLTVSRTLFVPVPLNVKLMLRPVPSAHCVPPDPSGPSSSHVYVHGVALHDEAAALNVTAWPVTGLVGE